MKENQSMTMLYKVAQGTVKESQYGLMLARVVPLPPGLVENATAVAQKLEQHLLAKKKTSDTVLKEKRRKLILNLKEHLIQAHTGVLEGEVLSAWLQELQKEFVNRMTALESEAAGTSQGSEYDENSNGDVETSYSSEIRDEDRPSTQVSQASIVSISSHATSSTLSSSMLRSPSEASTIRAVSDNER
jgi:DNA mismatch repair protein MSH4